MPQPQINSTRTSTPAPIRAVILDYGEVLCHGPEPTVMERLAGIFHLKPEEFTRAYSRSRNPYDQGVLSTEEYWKGFAQEAGVTIDGETAAKLPLWDIQMWSRINTAMTGWLASMHEAGIPTAILSNMTQSMKSFMLENFTWLRYFDCHIFSCDLKVIKPDPAIYLHTLDCLGAEPETTLFVDDRQLNVAAAQALGIQAFQFQGVERLRSDLESIGFPILPSIGEAAVCA